MPDPKPGKLPDSDDPPITPQRTESFYGTLPSDSTPSTPTTPTRRTFNYEDWAQRTPPSTVPSESFSDPDSWTSLSPWKRRVHHGDRYVPARIGDLATDFSFLPEPTTPTRKRKKPEDSEPSPSPSIKSEDNDIYPILLRNELGQYSSRTLDDWDPHKPKTINPATITPKRLFSHSYKPSGASSTIQYPHDSPLRARYSPSPLTRSSQALLNSPQRIPRHISKTPYKVLDAPDLQDDYYLNLIDWSSTNFLAVGLGTCVYLWSASTSKVSKLCDLGTEQDTVTSLAWMGSGSHIAVGTNKGRILLWDANRSKKTQEYAAHSLRVGVLAWNNDVLTSGGRDRKIVHRDVRIPDKPVRVLESHKLEVCGLKWNPTSSLLASGGNDNKLLIWNKFDSKPVLELNEHIAAVKAIAWSPHEDGLLVSGGGTADRKMRFWNTKTGNNLNTLDTGSQVCNLAWSRTSNEIVSTHGYSQNQIVVWKYPQMQPLATLTGHSYRVLYLAMSPDGQNIVTGAGDETLRFWNVFPKGNGDRKGGATTSIPTIR
ncbi:Fizzy- protein [Nowakowskiella sp. JEL0407]|nr:Fizzy- protein [Nowakowskiella sp. JEL0407]